MATYLILELEVRVAEGALSLDLVPRGLGAFDAEGVYLSTIQPKAWHVVAMIINHGCKSETEFLKIKRPVFIPVKIGPDICVKAMDRCFAKCLSQCSCQCCVF